MFVGAVPKPVVNQILRVCDFGRWGDVWIGCSGSFRVDGAIADKFPGVRVHANDVSLLSCALGRMLTGETLPFRFIERLQVVEDQLLGGDELDRLAALLVITEMAQFAGTKLFAKRIFSHYMTNFTAFRDRARVKLEVFRERTRIASFHAGDFREQAKRAAEQGGGVAAFAPTYRSGYEKLYQFIDDNTAWEPPDYGIWDPKQLPAWVDEVEGSGVPFCILTDHEIAGREAATVYYSAMNKPVYCFVGEAGKASVARAMVVDKPLRFEPVDPWAIGPKSRIDFAAISGAQASYLKRLYLAKGIRFATSTLIDLAVLVDGKLAGLIAYGRSFNSDFAEKLLTCDLSVSRERRLSKLIVLLASSREVVDLMDHRLLTCTGSLSTVVFTDKPVSMKYRGLMDLRKRHADGRLIYASAVHDRSAGDALAIWLKRYAGNQGPPRPAA
jgi:hypothetical protein